MLLFVVIYFFLLPAEVYYTWIIVLGFGLWWKQRYQISAEWRREKTEGIRSRLCTHQFSSWRYIFNSRWIYSL